MQGACKRCGRPFVAKRPSRVYCGSACRSKAAQARKAGLPESVAPVQVVRLPAPTGQLAAATRAELEAADRLDTMLGQAALNLAVRVDAGQDTGSAIAAMVRELRATMERALDGVPAARDELDELKARRVARLHA